MSLTELTDEFALITDFETADVYVLDTGTSTAPLVGRVDIAHPIAVLPATAPCE